MCELALPKLESRRRQTTRDDAKQVLNDDEAKFVMLLATLPQPIGVESNPGDVADGFTGKLPLVRRDHPGPAYDLAWSDPADLRPDAVSDRLDRNASRLNEKEVVRRVSGVREELAIFELKRIRS